MAGMASAQVSFLFTLPNFQWLMLPAAVVDQVLATLTPLLDAGDIIIDGGNSHYHDDIRRAAELKKQNIHYVDAGTSGGVFGIERGYCLMIGGEKNIVQQLVPIFSTLAPRKRRGIDHARPRRPPEHG